jgi:hypothetical protein
MRTELRSDAIAMAPKRRPVPRKRRMPPLWILLAGGPRHEPPRRTAQPYRQDDGMAWLAPSGPREPTRGVRITDIA